MKTRSISKKFVKRSSSRKKASNGGGGKKGQHVLCPSASDSCRTRPDFTNKKSGWQRKKVTHSAPPIVKGGMVTTTKPIPVKKMDNWEDFYSDDNWKMSE